MKVFLNVLVIVGGVILASLGEIKFVWVGFFFQLGGVVFEALRLTMVQRLLSSADYKMDPLVSLYYFAPVCAVMNLTVALIWEIPRVTMGEIYDVGLFTFFINGMCAFLLNVSVVFLVSSSTRQNHMPMCAELATRLARRRSWSLPFAACSRTLCWLRPRC